MSDETTTSSSSISACARADLDPRHVLETTKRPSCVMVRGEGSTLYDHEGRAYLDFVQGWAVNALGHSSRVVAEALERQARTLVHASAGFYNAPQIELANLLAATSGLERVFTCSTGAEANESAIKLARKWGSRNRGGAFEIVTTENAFHGRTLATMSASGKAEFAPLFEPKVPGFRKVPFGDAHAIESAIDERVVAILVEPIQGEAGVVVPPPGYLAALREIASRLDVLLIFDEVQTGIGRTGSLYAFEAEDARPDVLTLGKGLGGGVPLAAMLCRESIACFEPGDQGGTYAGSPLCSAVGSAVVREVSRPAFLARVNEASAVLVDALEALTRDFGGSVRGRGLLVAMELAAPVARDVVERARAKGLLLNAPRPSTLRFMPALDVSDDAITRMAEILRETLGEVVDERSAVIASPT